MKLRIKLILAFFFLAVVPLAGVTIYSYRSSQLALRQAVEAESAELAQDLQNRMDETSSDISRRVALLKDMPIQVFAARQQGTPGGPEHQVMLNRIVTAMGDTAAFIDSFEVTSTTPKTPAPPDLRAGHRPPPPPPPPPPGVFRFEMPPFATGPGNKVEWSQRLREMAHQADKQAAAGARSAEERLRQLEAKHMELELKLGNQFGTELMKDGEVVGRVRAQVRTRQLVRNVLSRSTRAHGEIPFALDKEGKLHAADPGDAARLGKLPLDPEARKADPPDGAMHDWVIATRKDSATGLTFGIARPIGERLQEIRRTAVRNLMYGLAMVGLALIGILPLSGRMTRNLSVLAEGAEQLARGNLSTRVNIRTKDEIGQLALAFNRMAEDLGRHEKNLVEQERLRGELELCRRIQEDLLPREAFRSGIIEARGVSIPAREVGGDFFNYFQLPSGDLALLIGDVSGKGLPAALLMANLQATLQARLPFEKGLAQLAAQLDGQIGDSTPAEVYLTLFMGILDVKTHVLRYVNAGHNTQFVLHAGGVVERLESTGRPLGLLPGGSYEERSAEVRRGEYLFFYTDGLAEAENPAGEEFGTDRLERLLVGPDGGIENILLRVEKAVSAHRGGREAGDDATMLLVRVGAA